MAKNLTVDIKAQNQDLKRKLKESQAYIKELERVARDNSRKTSSSFNRAKTSVSDFKKECQDAKTAITSAFSNIQSGNISGLVGSLKSIKTLGVGAAGGIAAVGAAAAIAAKQWADYNTEVAKANQVTKVTTGLSGPAADRMTDAARAMAQVYGVDFREAINSANTLMTQFGVSGDTAIQLLRDGMQGMIEGDGGKLLSMIQQYAPAFRDAGISASQLIAIIHNSEGGIFTDDNMNAIVMGIKNLRLMTDQTSEALAKLGINGEEMTRKLNDGSMTIFDALRQVSGAIDNVGSGSQAAGEVMQRVFGKQGVTAGTNLGKAIETLNTNLDETKRQTGELGGKVAELEEAHEKLNTAIRDCFEYDGWQTMATGIKTELITALAKVLEITKDIKDFYEKTGNIGSTFFKSIAAGAASTIPGLNSVYSLLKGIGLAKRAASSDGNNLASGANIAGALSSTLPEVKVTPPKKVIPPKKTTNNRTSNNRTSTVKPKVEPIIPQGSIKYIEDQLSKKRIEFSLATSPESRRQIQKEINDLLSQKQTMEIQAKFDFGQVGTKGADISDIMKKQFTDIDYNSIQQDASKKMGAVVDKINEEQIGKWQEGEDKKQKIKELQQQTLDSMINAAHSAADAFEMPEFDIMGTVAQAIANIAMSYSEAANSPAVTGTGWGWIAFAAAGLAETLAVIASIKSATSGYSNGGILGGSMMHGDQMLARVNSGEMILNGNQQSNLFNMINDGNNGAFGGNVHFILRGADLYGSMKNFSKQKSLVGKNTGIK